MLRLIFTFCCFLAAVATAQAGNRDDCANPGNDRCKWVHQAVPSKPAIKDEVCIFFVQPSSENVKMELTPKNGKKLSYSPTHWLNPEHTHGNFCIGRHWPRGDALWINICNETTGSVDYFGEELPKLAEKPMLSEKLTACLFGNEKCKEMGAKTWH